MPCLWIRRTRDQETRSQKVKLARIYGGLKVLFFQVSHLPLSITTLCSRISQNLQMLKKSSIPLRLKNKSQSKKSLSKNRMDSLSLMSISRKTTRLKWLHKMIMKANRYKKTTRLKLHQVIVRTPPSKNVGSLIFSSNNSNHKNKHRGSPNKRSQTSVLKNMVGGRWITLDSLQETSFCQLNRLRSNRKCNRTLLEWWISSTILTQIMAFNRRKTALGTTSICSITMICTRTVTKFQLWSRMVTFSTRTKSWKRYWSRTKAVKWELTKKKGPKTICVQLLPCSNTLSREWIKSCSVTRFSNLVSVISQIIKHEIILNFL